MTKNVIPYLCGGTFLTLLIRAKAHRKTHTEYTKGQKESLSENEIFRRLISIYRLENFDPGSDSLKTYTTGYKTCTEEYQKYLKFMDNDYQRGFDEDVRSGHGHSLALHMMSEFAQELTDDKSRKALVRCLLDMLLHDQGIRDEDELYISKEPVKKCQLQDMLHFDLPYFLLGVWHYIIMYRSENNLNGADTYKEWYPSGKDYKGTIGNGIDYEITVTCSEILKPELEHKTKDDESAKEEAIEGNPDSPNPEPKDTGDSEKEPTDEPTVINQYFNNPTVVYQNGAKNIHVDHVDILNI